MGVIKNTRNVNNSINNSVDIYDNIINNNENKSFTEYSKHLESNPIFVQYFNQDLVKTTTDTGLQAPNSLLGDSSPIAFNRVNRLPLYSVPVTQLSMDLDNLQGLKVDYSADGIIPPGTIIPKPGDYMIIPMVGVEYLFKVTSVNADTVRSNNYFKIEFKFSKINDGSIEKNIAGEFTVIYDNIGNKDSKAILRNDDIESVDSALELIEDIKNNIIRYTWDENTNFLMYKSFYDPWINEFIRINGIFNTENTNKEDKYHVSHPVVNDIELFNRTYKGSYIECLRRKDIARLKSCNYVTTIKAYDNNFSIFNMHYSGIKDVYEITRFNHFIGVDGVPAHLVCDNGYIPYTLATYITEDFLSRIVEDITYDRKEELVFDGYDELRNIIIGHFNNREAKLSDIIKYYGAYDQDRCIDTFEEFIVLISIIFILRSYINSVLNKN